VLIKPNWVIHQSHSDFPIQTLITSPALIEAVVRAVFACYQDLEWVRVGDVPLQSCDFDLMFNQSRMAEVALRCKAEFGDRVEFLDLRRERFRLVDGYMKLESDIPGDPSGYAEVILDRVSQLEEVSQWSENFRVSDYDPEETTSAHSPGNHRYLIARSVLEADLVINLPKMKTHQKSGITGALKNLVGINGSKAFLVHHRLGTPSTGGDEFPENVSRAIYWQVRLREVLQKRFALAFKTARLFWQAWNHLRGIKTLATRENLQEGNVYVGAGSWHGNDSIWRMVYDLNLILLLAPSSGGKLADSPQRTVISIMDALEAGEGNGPLQPLPVKVGLLIASTNPFLVDFAMAKLMGFDWRKIPLLANHSRFNFAPIAQFDPASFDVIQDGKLDPRGVDAIPSIRPFLPPPGWKGHIELD
jgi:uncharacterized protein (DUF362 family)